MSYIEQIKSIMDSVKPQFEILGPYIFEGSGDSAEITNAFFGLYEAYKKAKELTAETFGTEDFELEEGSMWCSLDGGTVGNDDSEMQTVYTKAKEQGILPSPLLEKIRDYAMQINRYFIAAQQHQ